LLTIFRLKETFQKDGKMTPALVNQLTKLCLTTPQKFFEEKKEPQNTEEISS